MAVMVSERRQRQRQSRELGKIVKLLSQHFLAEDPLLLEGLSGDHSLVMKDLYSKFTFGPLRNLYLGVSRLYAELSHSVFVVR